MRLVWNFKVTCCFHFVKARFHAKFLRAHYLKTLFISWFLQSTYFNRSWFYEPIQIERTWFDYFAFTIQFITPSSRQLVYQWICTEHTLLSKTVFGNEWWGVMFGSKKFEFSNTKWIKYSFACRSSEKLKRPPPPPPPIAAITTVATARTYRHVFVFNSMMCI